MSKERRVVSVHIEKTGGTSIEKFYKALFGPDRVLLYAPRILLSEAVKNFVKRIHA
jgi:hypothetical protein